MTEEAVAAPAPAPAPVPTEAAEAAPSKVAAVETKAAAEEEHAGAAPKTADDEAAAKAAPTTAPDETQEVAAAADAGGDEGLDEKKDPPPADSVISSRLRELLEETDLEKTSVRQLRTALESEFNCDLGSHKALLRETVDAFLAEKQPKEEEVAPAAAEEEEEAAAAAASASASEDEEEDDDDGEEPAPKKAKTSAKKGKGAKKGGAAAGGSTKGGGGFQKPLKLSPAMQEFTGEERLSRAQIVKKCWEYIKAENLQDPADKRKILVKGKLESIFTPPITMFSMNKQISKHVYPDDD